MTKSKKPKKDNRWTVNIKRCISKTFLPEGVKESLIALVREIEVNGPGKGNWPNYGKLSSDIHHCHLKDGRPTYVAVWEVTDKKLKTVVVTYAGTREKAPY